MISKRIQKIADLIEANSSVIDIGCDHALLDIYLTKEKNCQCIASDINENAIKGALKNIKDHHLEDKIQIFINDGLKNIEVKENSTVVIAGMGTSTILEIIKNSSLDNIQNFVIQSNNDHPLLRKEITRKYPYYIKDEITFIDRKKTYVIIKFSKGKQIYKTKDYYLGPILKNKNDIETISYYESLYKKNKEVIQQLPFKYVIKRLHKKIQNHMLKRLIK